MLRVEAYERFKKKLLSGHFRPGQFVSQRELSELVGVSLNPTREAIQRLEFENLLRVYPKKGVQIASANPKVINDAYDFRLIIEKNAVTHFCRRARLSQIQVLRDLAEDILQRLRASPANDRLRLEAVDVDWAMHDEIVDSMDNEIISEVFQINSARIRLSRTENRMPEGRAVSAFEEHIRLLEQCAARDVDAACELIERHIEISRAIALGKTWTP